MSDEKVFGGQKMKLPYWQKLAEQLRNSDFYIKKRT